MAPRYRCGRRDAVGGRRAGPSDDEEQSIQESQAPKCTVDSAWRDNIKKQDDDCSDLIELRTKQLAAALVTRGRNYERLDEHNLAIADDTQAIAIQSDFSEA